MTCAGNLRGMAFPISSLRLQRLLGGSVAALLTANAFAVVSLLGDDGNGPDRLRRPAATGDVIVPTADTPPTLALITTADGRTFVADPGTAEGRRAIAEARRDGGSVRQVTPPRTASSSPGSTLPLPGSLEGTAADLPGLVGDLLPKGTLPEDGDGLLEVDPDLIQGLLEDPVGTATSIVQSTPTTVTSIVQSTPTTVTSIVQSTPTTVTSVLDGATSNMSTLLAPLTPSTTAAPSLGVLGQVVTTVVTTVDSVTTTTVAPTTTTTTSVCTLLVLCS